jgi:hypothetical protein
MLKILVYLHVESISWFEALQNVMGNEATLDLLVGPKKLDENILASYQAILVDASLIEDPKKDVLNIHNIKPEIKMIVLTFSPNWEWARDVLQAGANSYLPLTSDIDKHGCEIRIKLGIS